MVVHDENPDDVVARVAHETALSVATVSSTPTSVPSPGRAVDSDCGADLGCSAAHRFEPEVSDEDGGGIEPTAIVTDFEDDQLVIAGDGHVGVLRLRVFGHVGKRLLPDPIEVLLAVRAHGQTLGRPLNVDRQCLASADRCSVFCQSRDQPLFGQSAWAQFEDQRPHLGER